MTVLSIFGALFTAGLVQVFRLVNRVEAKATAQSQAHIAFMRLDKEIRYARRISAPAKVGSAWYVEYLTYRVELGDSAPTWTCHALRLTGDKLQTLHWPADETPDRNTFSVLMSGVTATNPAAGPFSLPTGTSNDLQKLRFTMTVGAGSGATAASSGIDVTFTAVNSSITPANPAGNVCTEVR